MNIRSVGQVHGKGVTVLFDGYTSTGNVPQSIRVRGEKCDKDTHHVHVRFLFIARRFHCTGRRLGSR
jgi:hypothetical protein